MLSRLLLLRQGASNTLKCGQHVKQHSSSNSSAKPKATTAQAAGEFRPLVKSSEQNTGPQILQSADLKFNEGKNYQGFECLRTEYVPEFGITSYTFRHLVTGTELWYLDRNDPNNVFSVNFRTTPFDSTGLPHILEHSVLCGSKKFPVRDPFFKMLNRSVATFMNAMTGPDYTMYPFSSMNEIDFRNLQQIYLDAVFR